MKKKSIMGIVSFIFLTGCSVFGIRTSEELEYSVVDKKADVEIRRYKPYLSAQASKKGSYDEVQSDLFRILADYIFGKNTTDTSIAMTAPVEMKEESSQKIAMTAPVGMKEEQGGWTMSFSMPSKYTKENLPAPLDPRVKIIEVPEKIVGVATYSGFFDDQENRTDAEKRLINTLADLSKYEVSSKPSYFGYDPPFTIPFLRRNEVQIELTEK